MKRSSSVFGLALAMIAVTACSVAQLESASAVSASQAPTEGPIIWLAGTGDQDFADRVSQSVAANPESEADAIAVLTSLGEQAANGADVVLMGPPGDAQADLAALEAALQAVEVRTGASSDAESFAMGALSGPTDFELRGFAYANNTAWEVKTQIDGGYCNSNGCETTDSIKTTWKIQPGRTGDKFSFTSLYAPKTGLFKTIYGDAFVYRGTTLIGDASPGSGGAQDGTGSGSVVAAHPSQAGKRTVDKLRMRATFIPNATRYYDGVRTGTATCGTGSVYACYF